MKDVLALLGKKILCFDGAMGTMLHRSGVELGTIPELVNLNHPEVVGKIHQLYAEAGSDIITTNSLGANSHNLKNSGYSVEEIVAASLDIIDEYAPNAFKALDLGPIGILMEPVGEMDFETAYEIYKEVAVYGEKHGADLVIIETMSDLYETKAAILAVKENTKLPVFCTMTFQENGRTLMGSDIETAVYYLEALGVDVVGVNCSLGPEQTMSVINRMLAVSNIPVMVQPNAGLPKVRDGKTYFDYEPTRFGEIIAQMVESGVWVVGGCCGTNPDFIKAVHEVVKDLIPKPIIQNNTSFVCSSKKTVILDNNITLIGERINPTGKKLLKEALKNKDNVYILREALNQQKAGADVLDVNVGLPGIDEIRVMQEIVREIQNTVDTPLQIDSSNPEVISNALRICNGIPLINSVNGKQESLEKVLPLVKKYGSPVICLTLDDEGIPEKAERRVEIALKIAETAEALGILRSKLIIDTLVLPASATQEHVLESIKAIGILTSMGFKTNLGVSNVSFGLPGRKIINRTYLAMALYNGLSTAIIDPLDEEMMATIDAAKVLKNIDKGSAFYIEKYKVVKTTETVKIVNEDDLPGKLIEAILQGLRDSSPDLTKKLLEIKEPLAIIEEIIMPALDIVGRKYEKNEIFLPQLIQSAESVKKAFEVIKAKLSNSGQAQEDKGTIILATVKGDIHDIGKNIVKVLLENYGYNIIDLGKDVYPQTIVDAVITNNARLVGLSALMTTTVTSMEDTIKLIKEKGLTCKIMVGGAVLNEEYAKNINADFYAKDAQQSIKFAEDVFGFK